VLSSLYLQDLTFDPQHPLIPPSPPTPTRARQPLLPRAPRRLRRQPHDPAGYLPVAVGIATLAAVVRLVSAFDWS
jgi:hypothetical protein